MILKSANLRRKRLAILFARSFLTLYNQTKDINFQKIYINDIRRANKGEKDTFNTHDDVPDDRLYEYTSFCEDNK